VPVCESKVLRGNMSYKQFDRIRCALSVAEVSTALEKCRDVCDMVNCMYVRMYVRIQECKHSVQCMVQLCAPSACIPSVYRLYRTYRLCRTFFTLTDAPVL
jgi:hypothetical protein